MANGLATLNEKYGVQRQSNRAYESIRNGILSGKLMPGVQLKEHALCRMFALTRTPIRQAFASLASEGLVEQIPNVGAFVRKLGRREVVQLMEVRRILEAGAAAEAAEKVNPASCAELIASARVVEDALERNAQSEILEAEFRFHRQITTLCDNPELQRIFDGIHALFATLTVNGKPGSGHGVVNHLEIAEAIGSGNSARAYSAMWAHLSQGLKSLGDAGASSGTS